MDHDRPKIELNNPVQVIFTQQNCCLVWKASWSFSFSVHCQWGVWNQYSKCSRRCGGGTQTRGRSKSVTEKYGGTCTALFTEARTCNTQNCPSKFLFHNNILFICNLIYFIYSKLSVGRLESIFNMFQKLWKWNPS